MLLAVGQPVRPVAPNELDEVKYVIAGYNLYKVDDLSTDVSN